MNIIGLVNFSYCQLDLFLKYVSSVSILTILEIPVIAELKAQTIVEAGRRLQLWCSIQAGDPPIDFSWYLNGKGIPYNLQAVEADSVYSSTLNVREVTTEHSGNYSCIAKNQAGRVSESTFVVVEGMAYLFYITSCMIDSMSVSGFTWQRRYGIQPLFSKL